MQPITAKSYDDTNVAANFTYTYKVKACMTGGGCSDFSNTAVATLASAPQNFKAVVSSVSGGNATVTLSWDNTMPGNPDFALFRKTGAGSYAQIKTVGGQAPAVTTITTNDVLPLGGTYTYVVKAIYGTTLSNPSVEATVDLNIAALKGWAWSAMKDGTDGPFGVGWIHLTSDSPPVDPGSHSYGINVDDNGNLSGYAWSGIQCNAGEGRPATGQGSTCGYGWVSFDGATVNWTTGEVSGWAQFLSYNAPNGGWDGKVSLRAHGSEPGYGLCIGVLKAGDTSGKTCAGGVTLAKVLDGTATLNGYAWGGQDVVGWISFGSAIAGGPTPTTNAPVLNSVTNVNQNCTAGNCTVELNWTNNADYSEVRIYRSLPEFYQSCKDYPTDPIQCTFGASKKVDQSKWSPGSQYDSYSGLNPNTTYGFRIHALPK